MKRKVLAEAAVAKPAAEANEIGDFILIAKEPTTPREGTIGSLAAAGME